MSFACDICNYFGTSKYDLIKHNKTKKHYMNVFKSEDTFEVIEKKYICEVCNKQLKHNSSFVRHKKKCYLLDDNGKKKLLEELNSVKNELSMLKKDNEIEKLKFKVKVKDLKIKTLEHPTNQTINITNNIDNSNNKNATTNVKISKLEMLNNNLGQVIDMKTFTENFATPQYGLSERDAENLLEICNNNSSVDAIINSVLYYVNNSMKKQYENEYNIILPKDKIVLPFISSDLSLRYHFEKNDKEWCKTTSKSNINKIVTLTEKQVFDHKKESIGLNSYKKRRIVNGVLKESLLDNIDDSNNFYKSKDDKNTDNNVNHDNEIKN